MTPEELAAIEARAEAVPNVATHPDEMIRVGESQRDVKPLLSEVRRLQATIDRVRELAEAAEHRDAKSVFMPVVDTVTLRAALEGNEQ